MKIRIPIHSFVDLITNSSSETYVSATDKSIETIKNLVDELLRGEDLLCDEVLDIKLVKGDEYNPDCIEATAKTPRAERAAKIINQLKDTFEAVEYMN